MRATYKEHVQLNGLRFVGLATVGRAVAGLLQINDKERIEIRQELIVGGEFPF